MYFSKLFVAGIASATALSCLAMEQKQTPAEAFREQTQYHMLICQSTKKIAEHKAELGEAVSPNELGNCIRKAKGEAKNAFAPALRVVSKNKTASKLLKDYYAEWIASMNGLVPGVNERDTDYAHRQQAAQASYDAVWSRFEVETGTQ
jgi:hypothetical protein